MDLYDRYVLPRLIDLTMRHRTVAAERARLIPRAAGIVLELGIGSGLNLPFYGRAVERLYGVDPSPELWALASRRIARVAVPVEYLQASAEHIPIPDASVDTVVTTWTLCSTAQPHAALREVARVLRSEGRLLFVEHGRAPDPRVAAWQDRLTPAWRRLAGGCHLNRRIDDLIETAGFELTEREHGYGTGPRPMAYLYRGVARRARRARPPA